MKAEIKIVSDNFGSNTIGTITGSNNITLEGTGDIDGTGTISAGDIFIHGNKTILSSAFLTISSGDVDLNNIYSYMVTNYGHITIANDIIGKSSSTKYWTNQENSARITSYNVCYTKLLRHK